MAVSEASGQNLMMLDELSYLPLSQVGGALG
jgi:hypothetical protein